MTSLGKFLNAVASCYKEKLTNNNQELTATRNTENIDCKYVSSKLMANGETAPHFTWLKFETVISNQKENENAFEHFEVICTWTKRMERNSFEQEKIKLRGGLWGLDQGLGWG